jgi:alpha-tubulin suppressor-like RCC1 family protein
LARSQVWLLGGVKKGPIPLPEDQRSKLWHMAEVPVFNSQPLESISVGRYHALAVTTKGDTYSWGSNAHGQLGLIGTTELTYNSMKPEPETFINKIPPGGSILEDDADTSC